MKVLVINAGSSSLKYQIIDMDNEQCLCQGIAEKIGQDNANIKYKIGDNCVECGACAANCPVNAISQN